YAGPATPIPKPTSAATISLPMPTSLRSARSSDALKYPEERHRAGGERQHQRRQAVAAEAAVRAEIEVADNVIAAARPEPVRPGLVGDARIKQPNEKRRQYSEQAAGKHSSTSSL